MSIQQCESCDFLQLDRQEPVCVRCAFRKLEAEVERLRAAMKAIAKGGCQEYKCQERALYELETGQ